MHLCFHPKLYAKPRSERSKDDHVALEHEARAAIDNVDVTLMVNQS